MATGSLLLSIGKLSYFLLHYMVGTERLHMVSDIHLKTQRVVIGKLFKINLPGFEEHCPGRIIPTASQLRKKCSTPKVESRRKENERWIE
jgi:hypothetical protein